MSDKRKYRRVRRRLVLHFGESELNHVAFTNDVSLSGMFIVSAYLPSLDTRLHVRVDAGNGNFVYFEGVVVRQKRVPSGLMRAAKGGFGVRLLTTGELIQEIVGKGSGGAPAWSSPEAGKLRLMFPALDTFQKLFEEQIRRGGIVAPGAVAGKFPLDRDAVITLEFVMGFMAESEELSFPARVLQVLPSGDPSVPGGLALAFADGAAVTKALTPFLTASSPPP